MKLAILGAAAALAAPSEVCNLGGELVGDSCKCYPTFTGTHCSKLNMLPAKDSRAYVRPDKSSWGGSVAQADDGRYHMFFADMVGHCGLKSWECNSAVSHAVADSPEGPYEFVENILRPFAHNPTLKVHNGTWMIYHIGEGAPFKPELHQCTGGVTPTPDACKAQLYMSDLPESAGDEDPGMPNIIYSEGPDGPWTVQTGDSHWTLNNPTVYINDDASALAAYVTPCNSTVNPEGHFCMQVAIATADTWKGPFKFHSRAELYGEDVHMWKCPFSGTFHMIFQGGSYTDALPKWNGHIHMAHSPDGLSWTISSAPDGNSTDFTAGVSTNIPLVNGTVAHYTRRERHQMLLDSSGTPTHYFNGVTIGNTFDAKGDFSLTSVQPLVSSHWEALVAV